MKKKKESDLLFGNDVDGDILYLPNLQEGHVEHDYVVLLAKFLSERHLQKSKLMAAAVKAKGLKRKYYCEDINYDLSQEKNVEILTNAEQNAFDVVKNEAEALALAGHEKAISMYLEHVPPEKQNVQIRRMAEKIDEKPYKTAEEWEISAALHFYDKSEVGAFNQDYVNFKELCDKIAVCWGFTYYYAREKKELWYCEEMTEYADLLSQLAKTAAYEPMQKSQLAYYGRNFMPKGVSISSLDETLYAYHNFTYCFVNSKMFGGVAKKIVAENKSEKIELSKNNNFYFTSNELKDKLEIALKNGKIDGIFESEKEKIKIKDVPTYFFKKIKDYVSCDDEQIKERLAHARCSAIYDSDDKTRESGFWELETIASRAYKSEPMKKFNKIPRFLEEFQKLFESETENREKEELKL